MRFLVDANLPPGLAEWITQRGHEAVHVRDEPGADQDDRTILSWARTNDRVVLTKDVDFSVLAAIERDAPQIVWLRLGNATNAVLKAWLDPRFDAVIRDLEHGEPLVEVV